MPAHNTWVEAQELNSDTARCKAGGFRIRPGKDHAYTGDIPDPFILDEGDLIVAMTEQGAGLLGSAALLPQANRYLHNQRLGFVDRVDASVLDKRFLYLLFNTHSVRAQINGSASGTKVRHTAPERIYRVRVRMPQGWERKALRELTSFLKRGITPNYDDDAEGLVINQKCIRDGRVNLELARLQSKEVKPERLSQIGDVFVISTGEGTLGRVAQVKTLLSACTGDTHVTIVRPGDGVPRH